MSLSPRLVMRQGQSLVMTPQLLQAIKLLQLSNLELASFLEGELERNPLLERADEALAPAETSAEVREHADHFEATLGDSDPGAARADGDWAQESLEISTASLDERLGTSTENVFDADRGGGTATTSEETGAFEGLSASSWSGTPGSGGDGEPANLEAYVAMTLNLRDHLREQFLVACRDPVDRLVGQAIIDSVEETGYFSADLADLCARLGVALEKGETVLGMVQLLDPSGVGARDLAECLAIQLRELDRFDPAMQSLVANLPLVAKRDFAALCRLCQVDEEDLADMVAEIRKLDPKPGRAFGGGVIQPVVPDVTVRAASDGSWRVELNAESLPRILVNQTFATSVARGAGPAADKSFVATCLQNANWLTKSLEQRAKTILKVSTEIVRQQDAFFAHGVQHLRPLNLKTVADVIGMHESTVSRVTSNKYMASPRGLFELKYFFTASIPARTGLEAHSAEAVRFRIKQMIEQESPRDVLSDDAIVLKLKDANIVIARRTVAKYRESLRIPSSVERRRDKAAVVRIGR